jgi:alkylation response protein AidB-like acyl-CoA dehydrogenase
VLTFIRHIGLRDALDRLLGLARRTGRNGRPAAADPVVRQRLAALVVAERCLQLGGYRSLTRILRGGRPGPEGSTSKLFWSRVDQDVAQLATEILGPASQLVPGAPGAPDGGDWALHALVACASGIRAGTSEILLNILGERVLGLPRG